MSQFIRVSVLAIAALLVMSVPAMAQEGGTSVELGGKAFGIGIVVLGAALGIGKIGASAVESMARQPEVAGDIRGAMVVAAALIEGAAFFGILMAWLVNNYPAT